MNKIKGIRPILFITTFGITLFLIYASTTFTLIDSDSNPNVSQLSNSTNNITMKSNPESNTSNIEQLLDVSSETDIYQQIAFETDAYQQIALLNEQDNDDRTVISRGTTDRDTNTYYKENQIEKPLTPTEASVAPVEVESATPEESAKTAADQSTAPAEVSSSAEIEDAQSTLARADSQYENDLDVLARLITAEAQGEPYDAKVAVGAVVMNRVKSGLWANTITDVIYQNINGYYQFTPVVNGWIDKPAEPECIEAAKAAISGVDPTNGAQFYYDDKSTNTWILSKPVSVQIGHMIYAY